MLPTKPDRTYYKSFYYKLTVVNQGKVRREFKTLLTSFFVVKK